jgi:hypothetical protein
VTNTKQRLKRYEHVMNKRLHKNTSEQLANILLAQRITAGLEERLRHVAELGASRNSRSAKTALGLIYSDLEIPHDAVSTLATAERTPPLRHQDWRPTLDLLFKKIANRKSFIGQLKIGTR